jgi:hypothetical protein
VIFKPTNPDKIASDMLYEARRLALEHKAAAEHHAALAGMYERRVEWLAPLIPQPKKAQQ